MKRLTALAAALILLPIILGTWLLLRKKCNNKEEDR